MTPKSNRLKDIRHTFLDFFAKNDHEILHSAPLVPQDDPTLLFVNAGMVPFKNRFTGLEQVSHKRATTSQKCVRAGGKHNDLDNVGYTARHHTFFEMLGNFSFGDYFKEQAIYYAWTLLTKEFGLNPEKLLITVFHNDDEAVAYWKKIAGLSDDKIIRINSSDNFWSMGDTGPCGPCSEIFYDHGSQIAGGPPGSPDEDGDRFIEIWNLVFMQFDRQKDGTMLDLPAPSIDTGMGLERFAALLQGKHDNYDVDLMQSIIRYSADVTKTSSDGEFAFSHRIIADHLRSVGFLIADGVLPSNDGRGYVLRRIMRRAMRHAHIMGIKEPLMHQLVSILIETMGIDYPELVTAESLIKNSLEQEEEAFRKTLSRGLDLLNEATDNMSGGDILSGNVAFKLYDTYGFPLDLTQDILRNQKITVNEAEFDAAMVQQKETARSARNIENMSASDSLWIELANKLPQTEFTGYGQDTTTGAIILALVQNGKLVQTVQEGKLDIICDKTSFYAESGGQIGDIGFISHDHLKIRILDCSKKAGKFHVMHGEIISGTCKVLDQVTTEIDITRRQKIRANHSATHLLHAALRKFLGDAVTQKGSLVTENSLRFDFSHSKPLTKQEIYDIQAYVNTVIRGNSTVTTEVLAPDAARAKGALALFGEKYGDEVRVLSMGQEIDTTDIFSIELCGGTHVQALGDIGCFTIISETGISSGVRRIEALTSQAALENLNQHRNLAENLSQILKVPNDQLENRVTTLLSDKKQLEAEISSLKKKLASGAQDNTAIEDINGIKFIGRIASDLKPKEIAELIDQEKQKIGSGVIAYLVTNETKVNIAIGVTQDLTNQHNAVTFAKAASVIVGGKGGGGRPDFAQAGGSDISKVTQALDEIKKLLGE